MKRALFAIAIALTAASAFAWGGPPDWVTQIAHAPQMTVPEKADAVVLIDQTIVTVRDDGEVRSLHRIATRILRNGGRDATIIAVPFDDDARLISLHGWSINAAGAPFNAGDPIETGASEELYGDQRVRALQVPGDIGSVVAFEYERREHPLTLQSMWQPQREYPVQLARFTVELPSGWSHEERWFNAATPPAASASPTAVTWELKEIPAIEDEPRMPVQRSVAIRLGVNFIPRDESLKGKSHRTWDDVAKMVSGLAAPRAVSSPELAAKAKEITASSTTLMDRVAALAAFVQRDVRYVAIEIGRGAIQPHLAADVFSHRYGDCKDKVTLMTAMLREVGVTPIYVLANTVRGSIDRDFASLGAFNHAIIAIPLPPNVDSKAYSAVLDVPRFGRVLLFDPTSDVTPFGFLPPYLQENRVLLCAADHGERVDIPAHPAEAGRLTRSAKLALADDGALTGEIRETMSGAAAAERREVLQAKNPAERQAESAQVLSWHLAQSTIENITFENISDLGKDLVVTYKINAPAYAKRPAGIWLVRPRVVGRKAETVLDLKDRKYAYESGGPSLDVDDIDITLPALLDVDELPPPAKIAGAAIRYSSQSSVEAGHLRYHREYRVERIVVPRDQLADLNKVFSQILSDERASVVLKRK